MHVVAVEATHEIGKEHEAALKNPNHNQVVGTGGFCNIINQFVNTLGDGVFIDQDFFYIMRSHGVASEFP